MGGITIKVKRIFSIYHKLSTSYAVDGDSFAGLNFRGFDPMKYFIEILLRFIHQEHLCYIDNY